MRCRILKVLPMVCLVGIVAAPPNASAAEPFPDVPGAETVTYREVGDVALRLHVFKPEDWAAGQQRPAIVFFFGGGWRSGSPRQFAPQAEYLASRGMVAVCAEYRIHNRHESTVAESVTDARSAICYVRAHAEELGIDPERIAAAGGSAGGHLAAATATLPKFDAAEDPEVSCAPNALVLFNPAVDVSAEGLGRDPDGERQRELSGRFGAEAGELSPTNHVRRGLPPAIIFHGMADSTVPYAQVEQFERKMLDAGNECELVGYPEAEHGFFNAGRDGGDAYRDTLRRTDRFLHGLGWLEGAPTM